jgi:hypothetical protein
MTESEDSQHAPEENAQQDGSPIITAGEPVPAPMPRWRRKQVWIVLAAAAIVAVAASFLVGTGSGFRTGIAGPLGATPTLPAASHPAVTTTLAPAATPEQVAASVKMPAKLRATLRAWNNGRGGKALVAVSSELGTAMQSGGVMMFSTMRTACDQLFVAVRAARAGPPIPNGALQKTYSAALTQLARAAAGCHAAISKRPAGDEIVDIRVNQGLLHSAQAGLSAGIKDLYRITAGLASAAAS